MLLSRTTSVFQKQSNRKNILFVVALCFENIWQTHHIKHISSKLLYLILCFPAEKWENLITKLLRIIAPIHFSVKKLTTMVLRAYSQYN